jgi:[acyl-carrier-protein] S-malonyltransferase
MLVVVCPGQGSQTPGFLEPWLANPSYAEQLREMSEQSQTDLVTAAIGGIAGHSVGEITAAAGAGVLSAADALSFVGERGRAMKAAAALAPTGMSAVLGGDEAEILARLTELGLEPANFNGGGQIVVAGDLDALAALAANPPAKTRVIPLQVAGAFHTRHMVPAVEHLADVARGLSPQAATLPLWTNSDGTVVSDGPAFVDLLVGQVSSPVRWDLCMQAFADAGVTGIIEVAPAGALVGLAKRALRGIPSVAIKTPDDLPAAYDLIDQQA